MSDEWDFPVHKGFHAGSRDRRVLEALAELESLTGESTSEVMKRAIRMYVVVESTLDEQEVVVPEPQKRHLVAQAIRDELLDSFRDD